MMGWRPWRPGLRRLIGGLEKVFCTKWWGLNREMSHMTRVEYYTPVTLVLSLISHRQHNTNTPLPPLTPIYKAVFFSLIYLKNALRISLTCFSHNFQHFIIYLQVQTLIIFLHLLYPQNYDARRTNLRKGKILISIN